MPRPDTGTRQKLIDTATGLLWTSSYGAVSVDDICRKADVKKGSFYHYFSSKLELAVVAMEEYFETYCKPDMDRIFAANTSLDEQIDALADSILEEQRKVREMYGHVCGCPMAALGSEMVGEENIKLAKKIEEMFERFKVYLYDAISAAIDAGTLPPMDARYKTEEVHDFITGQMMVARVHNSLEGLERDLKTGLKRILGLDSKQIQQKKSI
jgi:TetR/AcrR family transcriptional repressor of nem operon